MAGEFRVEHRTQYVYETTVSMSHHVACLEPRVLPFQQVRAFTLAIDPAPTRILRRVDYFGNVRHQFQVLGPHDHLTVTAESRVEVGPRARQCISEMGEAWQCAREWLGRLPADQRIEVAQYSVESPQVVVTPEIAEFARLSFPAGRSLLDGAVDLMHRIHADFTFDATATTPATPVSRVLAVRRGVCQDFAHFQIACLRSIGLAARYVSGYLRTDPPPGQPRLIGADASHAWVSVYVPECGWVDLDPTNDLIVSQGHVTIGWGRDYSDVTPLRGVLLGGARHQLLVGVSVVPLDGSI